MKQPSCILNACPHAKAGGCRFLGECGANYALTRARELGGYEIINFENNTLKALKSAKLVEEVSFNGSVVTVTAVRARAAA